MHNKTNEKTNRRVLFASLILGTTALIVVSILGYQFVNKADACESPPSKANADETLTANEQAPEGASCNLGAQDTAQSMALMTKLAQEKLSLVDTRITANFTNLSPQDISLLQAFVKQEASCCAFLDLELKVDGKNASLRAATINGQGTTELQMYQQVLTDAVNKRQ